MSDSYVPTSHVEALVECQGDHVKTVTAPTMSEALYKASLYIERQVERGEPRTDYRVLTSSVFTTRTRWTFASAEELTAALP